MKHFFIFLLLTFSMFCYSQKVMVHGIAHDTTNGRNGIHIILNDTINKVFRDKTKVWETYNKVWNDSNYVVHTDNNGRFKIMAKMTDSLTFESYRHIAQKHLVSDLLKMKAIVIKLNPEICKPYVECIEKNPKLYVFVGEKISIADCEEVYYCDMITMNSKFSAQYKIQEMVYGSYCGDTITFTVYDHYGRPQFGKFQNVLLYVSEYCNEFIHQKYQFTDVYKTTDGRWASPYHFGDYSRLDSTSKIKPEIINFEVPVEYDISRFPADQQIKFYPSPYYKIEKNKAIAVYGNYLPELFEIKKKTILKAREIKIQ